MPGIEVVRGGSRHVFAEASVDNVVIVSERPTILTEFKEPPGLFQSRLESFGKEIFGL